MRRFLTRIGVLAAWCTLAPGQAADLPPVPRDALVAANYRQGMLAFQQRCSACHALAAGSVDLAGPSLHGMFSRRAGTKPGFAYSDALDAAAFTWTPERLVAFIAAPSTLLPGTTMRLPEPVPEGDRIALVSFVMQETGAADWPKPAPPAGPPSAARIGADGEDLAQRFPSFWNHLMTNTTRYRLRDGATELRFDAYFNRDGSVSSSLEGVRGFWRVDERDMFCYAIYGLAVAPRQFVECFPVVAMSIPRFREELWTTTLPGGQALTGGIVAGRPPAGAP